MGGVNNTKIAGLAAREVTFVMIKTMLMTRIAHMLTSTARVAYEQHRPLGIEAATHFSFGELLDPIMQPRSPGPARSGHQPYLICLTLMVSHNPWQNQSCVQSTARNWQTQGKYSHLRL